MDHLSEGGPLLEQLKEHVHALYHQTNSRYRQGVNPHLKFNKEAKAVIDTPAVEKPDFLRVAYYFREARYVSILSLLSEVEKAAPFLHCFGHGSKTHEKKRPDAQTFFGAILALDGRPLPLQHRIGPDGQHLQGHPGGNPQTHRRLVLDGPGSPGCQRCHHSFEE